MLLDCIAVAMLQWKQLKWLLEEEEEEEEEEKQQFLLVNK